jgi:hypothetical protein
MGDEAPASTETPAATAEAPTAAVPIVDAGSAEAPTARVPVIDAGSAEAPTAKMPVMPQGSNGHHAGPEVGAGGQPAGKPAD